MIGFGDATYFTLGLIVLFMLYGVFRLARWRRAAREAFAGPRSRTWPSVAFWPRSLFLLAAAALIVVAAARPQWGHRQLTREVEGIDLVIVLDISQSMTADDVSPSRMKVAQDNLATLVDAERGSRFGLVLFAGSAFLRSPLTGDSQAMKQLILRADREAGLTRVGSDLGGALRQAGNVLATSENSGRAVVLVSDGEDFAGTYEQEAQALAGQGIAIYTAGVGTAEGALLYDANAIGQRTPKTDANGPVISHLDEASLQTIAGTGGGSYVHLDGSSSTALLGIRNDLARLDQTPLGSETQDIPIERFQYFVAAALILLLLSWFTPSRLPLPSLRLLRRVRPRPVLTLLLLAALIGGCGADALRQRNEEANRLYDAGDYADALAGYQKLITERPDIDEFSYNAGNALDRLGAYERAVTETQRALPPLDPALGARTYYALGNHLLALQRLEEAYVAYRNALLLDPTDQDAKFNLEYVLNLVRERNNPQPTPEETPQASGQGPPPPGEGTPQPGSTGQPGEGNAGAAGTPTPAAGEGATPSAAPSTGTPSPSGTPSGEGPTSPSPEDLQRQLAEALAGIGDDLTYEQAIKILDLLRQQQEQQLPAAGGNSGPDY